MSGSDQSTAGVGSSSKNEPSKTRGGQRCSFMDELSQVKEEEVFQAEMKEGEEDCAD